MKWSRRVGLNHRPTVYETVALPLSYAGSRKEVLCERRVYPIKTSRHHISCGIHCQPAPIFHLQVTPQPLVSLFQHYEIIPKNLLWRIPGTPCVICITRFWQLFLYTLYSRGVVWTECGQRVFTSVRHPPHTPFTLDAREGSAPPLATLPLAFPCIDIPYKMTYGRPFTTVRCKTALFRLNP